MASPPTLHRGVRPVSNVVPLHRGTVIPMRPSVLSQRLADDAPTVDLYRSLEEQRRLAAVVADERRDARVMFWQAIVKWSALAVAYATIVYFIFQAGGGVL